MFQWKARLNSRNSNRPCEILGDDLRITFPHQAMLGLIVLAMPCDVLRVCAFD